MPKSSVWTPACPSNWNELVDQNIILDVRFQTFSWWQQSFDAGLSEFKSGVNRKLICA